MKVTYDPTVDALSVQLWSPPKRAGRIKTVRVTDTVRLDFTADGRVVALEILRASDHLPEAALAAAAPADEMLTLAEAADAAGLAAAPLRVQLHHGRLQGVKRGRDWYVSRAALYTYLESRPSGNT